MGFLKDWSEGLKRQISSLSVNYLGGHPDLVGPKSVGLGKDDDKLVLYSGSTYKAVLEVPINDIANLTLERASHRSTGKAAAGAIVGGVLTGGIGAIAGAAIGGRKKDDSIIVLTVKYGAANVDLLFTGDDTQKLYPKIAKLLRQ